MNTSDYEGREQTLIKHRLLQRYLAAAIPIIGSWADDLYYVDCLAGPWESVSKDLSDTSFSLAVKSLQSAKTLLAIRNRHPSLRCLFIEKDSEAFSRLEQFCSTVNDIEVIAKKWDFEHSVPKIVNSVTRRKSSFPFFFIDPKGWECAAIPLIQPLLELSPGEVIINLMTSWISRFLSDPNKNFQKLLGNDVGRIANLQGDERERELVRCYSEAVRKAGNFPYVCTMPVLKSVNESFHFHMIYATRSPKGVEEFKKAEKDVVPLMHSVRADAQHRRKFESTQQYSLLEPGDTYQENRYSRYREANLGFAREAVNRKVQEATPTIAFDDVWAEWMQFACVQDEDLQDCIGKLARDGTITIENRPNRALKLTRGKNIRLKRI